MKSNSCYICLENTNVYIISNVCNCKIYSHSLCYESWLSHTNRCMICKRIISYHNNNYIGRLYLNNTVKIPIIAQYLDFMNRFFGTIIEFIIKKCQSLIGFILLFGFSLIMIITVIIPLVLIVTFRMIYHMAQEKIYGEISDNQNYQIFICEDNK